MAAALSGIDPPLGRAWLALAVGDERQHGGNDGYDDDPAFYYSWDSAVPNHGAISPGDAIVLWDKLTLLGASVIEDIEIGSEPKPLYRCNHCGRATIKERKRLRPRFRCDNCHNTFNQPSVVTKTVTTYRSRHNVAWTDLSGRLSGKELRSLCASPGSQLSLRPFRWDAFVDALRAVSPLDVPAAPEHRAEQLAGGHRQATVRLRVGKAAFRARLLEQFGSICGLTGPAPAQALEACHLYSYAATGEHADHGGLLLRRDVSRLFDLGLLAVNPTTLRVYIDPALERYPAYRALAGGKLAVPLKPLQLEWLRAHWHEHREMTRQRSAFADADVADL